MSAGVPLMKPNWMPLMNSSGTCCPSHLLSAGFGSYESTCDGQQVPEEFIKGIQFGFIKGTPALMGSPYKFTKHGQCGMEVSEQFPHIAGIADEITLVRSMVSDEFNHANAQLLMHNGFRRVGRPSMGSWVTYGLGSENQNLPGFVVLMAGNGMTNAGTALWSNGF